MFIGPLSLLYLPLLFIAFMTMCDGSRRCVPEPSNNELVELQSTTWISPCLPNNTYGLQSKINTIQFGEYDRLQNTTKFYQDTSCSSPLQMTIYARFDFYGGDAVSSPSDAKTLNMINKKNFSDYATELTLHTDTIVTKYNSEAICEYNNWIKGATRILGSSSNSNCPIAQTFYSIYKHEGNTLYIGVSSVGHEGTTEATRHNTYIDTPYTLKMFDDNIPTSWSLPCHSNDSQYTCTRKLTFNGATAIDESKYYYSSSLEWKITSEYSIKTESNKSPINIDFTEINTTLTLLKDSAVLLYNNNSICGFNNWAKNTSKNITQKTIGECLAPKSSTFYSVFKLSNDYDPQAQLCIHLVGSNFELGEYTPEARGTDMICTSSTNTLSIFGKWQSQCLASDTLYVKRELSFHDDSWIVDTVTYFSDTSCSLPVLELEHNTKISINEVTIDDPIDIDTYNINYDPELVTVFLTPKTDELITTYITNSTCGYNDWVKDSGKNRLFVKLRHSYHKGFHLFF